MSKAREARIKKSDINLNIGVVRENVIGLLNSGSCIGNWSVMEALSNIHTSLDEIERLATSLTADIIRMSDEEEEE